MNIPSRIFALLAAIVPFTLFPQTATAQTLLGSVNGASGENKGSLVAFDSNANQTVLSSPITRPRGMAFDGVGNLFYAVNVVDGNGNFQASILKRAPDGVTTTFATGFGDNIFIEDLKFDRSGNLFTIGGDSVGNPAVQISIFKITQQGTVSTFASFAGSFAFGLAFDNAGNLYAAIQGSQMIYRFTPAGVSSVVADSTKFAPPFTSLSTEGPTCIAFDSFGNLFVSTEDENATGTGTILKFSPNGTETTFAAGLTNNPRGVTFDPHGNLFVSEMGVGQSGDILMFDPNGTKTVFLSGIGSVNGNGGPEFLVFQPPTPNPSNLYVSLNNLGPAGASPGAIVQYAPDGTHASVVTGFQRPRGPAFDNAGDLFFASTIVNDPSGNFVGGLYEVTPSGALTTVTTAFPPNFFVQMVRVDKSGNLFVLADDFNDANLASTIYQVASDGSLTFFGSIPGQTEDMVFDSAGNLFAADDVFNVIYKFTSAGVRTVFVGPSAFTPISPTGPNQDPIGLAFDNLGNLYVTTEGNPGNDVILKFAPDRSESIFATGLTWPRGMAFDAAGNLFVAEVPPSTTGDILKFTPSGAQTVIASGLGRAAGNGGPEFLTFPPNTSVTGSNVTSNLGTSGSTSLSLTFSNVTAAGTTTATPIDPSAAGSLPGGYQLDGSSLAFDITTSATYTAPIIIAFHVPSMDPAVFAQLRVLHNEGGTLVDVTAAAPAPDPNTRTIYASVNSLSPFVLAKFVYKAQVQAPINADGSSVFNSKRGVIPVKFTLTKNGSSTCSLPPATISLARTADGALGAVNESVYIAPADSGSNFRADGCQYIYNLNASGLGVGTYRIDIKINGQVPAGSAVFQIK